MKIRYAAKTDVGMKRTHNEDNYFLLDEDSLFIVADGMGGHSSGEVASKMATEAMAEFFQRTRDAEATWPETRVARGELRLAVQEAGRDDPRR